MKVMQFRLTKADVDELFKGVGKIDEKQIRLDDAKNNPYPSCLDGMSHDEVLSFLPFFKTKGPK